MIKVYREVHSPQQLVFLRSMSRLHKTKSLTKKLVTLTKKLVTFPAKRGAKGEHLSTRLYLSPLRENRQVIFLMIVGFSSLANLAKVNNQQETWHFKLDKAPVFLWVVVRSVFRFWVGFPLKEDNEAKR